MALTAFENLCSHSNEETHCPTLGKMIGFHSGKLIYFICIHWQKYQNMLPEGCSLEWLCTCNLLKIRPASNDISLATNANKKIKISGGETRCYLHKQSTHNRKLTPSHTTHHISCKWIPTVINCTDVNSKQSWLLFGKWVASLRKPIPKTLTNLKLSHWWPRFH